MAVFRISQDKLCIVFSYEIVCYLQFFFKFPGFQNVQTIGDLQKQLSNFPLTGDQGCEVPFMPYTNYFSPKYFSRLAPSC